MISTARAKAEARQDDLCPLCKNSLYADYERREWCCNKCGFTRICDVEVSDEGQRPAGLPKPRLYRLGANTTDPLLHRDCQKNFINSQVRTILKTASKWDRQRIEPDQAAVERIANLYDKFVYHTYDDGLKQADLEILKQHAKNMVAATGPKQDEIRLMETIRYFIRKKLERYPELREFFKLGEMQMKIRYKREKPKNISGRGNQLGKNRKEGRIDYCNLCKTEIENYGTREHHGKYHENIPYHQYISRKNQHVRRVAMVSGVTVDCSSLRYDHSKKTAECGPCTMCDVPNATIMRYRVRVSKKNKIDMVSRIVARHKDSTGRWKSCILEQHKRSNA